MRRHDLCWIDPDAAWEAMQPGSRPRLAAWLQARLPLVVARRDPAVDGDALRLGVPLPLIEQRQRLGVRVAPGGVQRHAAPPSLEDVTAGAPHSHRAALRALHDYLQALPCEPRVFGSFAWQYLTGLAYVHAGSDLDLLWEATDEVQADHICRAVTAWEGTPSVNGQGLRVDGELRFPGGRAVNWREYASGADRLLVKADAGCWLASRASLYTAEAAA